MCQPDAVNEPPGNATPAVTSTWSLVRRVPLHAVAGPIAIGALTCGMLFDIASHPTAQPCSQFSRPARYLIAFGLASGLVAGISVGREHLQRFRGTAYERLSLVRIIGYDLSALIFVGSILLRPPGSNLDCNEPVASPALTFSVVGWLVLMVATVLSAALPRAGSVVPGP